VLYGSQRRMPITLAIWTPLVDDAARSLCEPRFHRVARPYIECVPDAAARFNGANRAWATRQMRHELISTVSPRSSASRVPRPPWSRMDQIAGCPSRTLRTNRLPFPVHAKPSSDLFISRSSLAPKLNCPNKSNSRSSRLANLSYSTSTQRQLLCTARHCSRTSSTVGDSW
jgi:hypothetical protein